MVLVMEVGIRFLRGGAVGDGYLAAMGGVDALHHRSEQRPVGGGVMKIAPPYIIMYHFMDDDVFETSFLDVHSGRDCQVAFLSVGIEKNIFSLMHKNAEVGSCIGDTDWNIRQLPFEAKPVEMVESVFYVGDGRFHIISMRQKDCRKKGKSKKSLFRGIEQKNILPGSVNSDFSINAEKRDDILKKYVKNGVIRMKKERNMKNMF